jgi:hypothetical protein
VVCLPNAPQIIEWRFAQAHVLVQIGRIQQQLRFVLRKDRCLAFFMT